MAKLTAAGRKRIKPANFAGPDKSYPIEDISHARNALSRAAQNASPHVAAMIRAHVHAKYPSLGTKK